MSTLQKWLGILAGLGAGFLVFTHPDAFYKAADAFRRVTAGSIVQVTTGGQGNVQ